MEEQVSLLHSEGPALAHKNKILIQKN
jgi:hypothetical protein